MHLAFDILEGAGLAAAIGLRPFLPAVLAGALATGDIGIDFSGSDFAFLESWVFIVIMAVAAAATIVVERRLGGERLESGPLGAAFGGVAMGLGALFFAGTLAGDHHVFWPGLIAGLVCAAIGTAAARGLFGRVRGRLDREAQQALPVYAEGSAVGGAGLTILFPPLAVILLAFQGWLIAAGRRRAGEKYAGLRILR